MRTPLSLVLVSIVGFVTWTTTADRVGAAAGHASLQSDECDQDFPTAGAPDPTATVVMCGLENPRGLAFDESALYVAEAGRGGTGSINPPSFVGQAGGNRFFGPTGAITRLFDGVQQRVATGLPSHAAAPGTNAIGPNGITFAAPASTAGLDVLERSSACDAGCLYVAIGLQQPPSYRTTYPFLADFAKVVMVSSTGAWSYVADIGSYETEHDPDRVFLSSPKLDSNPYGLLSSGHSLLLADAGGNSLLRIQARSQAVLTGTFNVTTAAIFAPHPDDSVPTSVTTGPDSAYYVGELTGLPPVAGAANVYRVPRSGEPPEVCVSGFTMIMDIAFDPTGNLYVLEFPGSLVRVTPTGTVSDTNGAATCGRYATGQRTTLVSGLTNPTSIAVGPDNGLYVSNRGTGLSGQVTRFER